MTAARAAWLASCLWYGGGAEAGTLLATVKTAAGRPVADAAVVAEPLFAVRDRRPGAVSIAQRGREFIPYLTIVEAGTAVEFPNRDPVKHHVYSFSPAKFFEIKLYAGKPERPVVFDKAGEVALGCNIHDWMEAYVLVVNSPYFAKTGEGGKAVIADAPEGRYRVRVWHPRQRAAPAARAIRLDTGAPARLEWVLDMAPRSVKAKPPLEADRY